MKSCYVITQLTISKTWGNCEMKGSRRVEYYNKIKETTYAFNVSSHVRANVFYKVHSTFFYILFYYYIWRCAGDDGGGGGSIEAITVGKVVRMTVMVKVSYH